MALLVRKIEKSKWMQKNILNGELASADAITNSLKTTNNTLSVWRVESEAEIEKAVLAIVSESQHLDAIDIIILDQEEIKSKKLELTNSLGKTPFKEFIHNHCDIVQLDYGSLGKVADIIINSFKKNRDTRYTKSQLKKIISDGIVQGSVKIEELNENIIRKLD